MNINTILLFTGGLGLLLFGMKMMSGGLETIAGDKLQNILRKATSNRFLGVLVGIITTIVINSSTATTIMTVGFVNSGLLSLSQSIGIIMGANVGTTFSAQVFALLGMEISLRYIAAVIIFLGAVMHVFFRKRRIKNIGAVIFGLGILFMGITVMSDGMRPLRADEGFQQFLVGFTNPVLALLAGFAVTAIIQSSTATTAILVTMLASGIAIDFRTSAFILLGVNIGTSLTTVIASIPASRESKRAAFFHIMYDIIGSVVFGTLIIVFPQILDFFTNTWSAPAQQAAMFHTIYNVSTMLLLLPFVKYIAMLMQKIVPIKETDDEALYDKKLMYLDVKIAQRPAVFIQNAHLELCRIHKIANDALALATEAFLEGDPEKAKRVAKLKKTINALTRKTSTRLVKANNTPLISRRIGKMFRTLYDLERIGDHAENIIEYMETITENELNFPDEAMNELKELCAATLRLAEVSAEAFEHQAADLLPQIEALEDTVDNLCAKLTENHINRLTSENFEPRSGVIFTDIIIDLERSADHSYNIAASVLTDKKKTKKKKTPE